MFGDLGKLIVAKGFKKLPKVQKIARSGHTGSNSIGRKILHEYLTLSSRGDLKYRSGYLSTFVRLVVEQCDQIWRNSITLA